MPPILNTKAVNFDALPEELQGIQVSKGFLLPTYMFNAMTEFLDSVDVIENDGKTPLYTWEFFDLIKKAEDGFNPGKIAELTARIPTIEDFEIDTEISRSELISHYRGYQRWLMGLKSLDEALKGDWATYFLQQTMRDLMFKKLAAKGVWKGVRTNNQADRGADKSFTGLIKHITDGCAVGGDIPTENQVLDDAIVLANAYSEINAFAQKAYDNEDLTGIEQNYYLSHQEWTLYCQARVAASNGTLAPGTMTDTPDYMPTIKFKPQIGLSQSDVQVITPRTNIKFSVNTNPEHYNFEMVKVIKGHQLNLLASGGVDYGYGKYLFVRQVD